MIASARNQLAAALVRTAGRLRLAVTGTSMLPAIRPSDLLLIRRCDVHAARVGDVVLFLRDDRLFAHRVVANDGAALVTRGDALDDADPPIGRGELLGRVERIVRRGRVMRTPALRRARPWTAPVQRLRERLGL